MRSKIVIGVVIGCFAGCVGAGASYLHAALLLGFAIFFGLLLIATVAESTRKAEQGGRNEDLGCKTLTECVLFAPHLLSALLGITIAFCVTSQAPGALFFSHLSALVVFPFYCAVCADVACKEQVPLWKVFCTCTLQVFACAIPLGILLR